MRRLLRNVGSAFGVGLVGQALVLIGVPLAAQTAITADGVVESTTGGFKFPDGSIQVSAFTSSAAPVRDTGQQSCWAVNGDVISCAGTGQDGELQVGVAWPTPRLKKTGPPRTKAYTTE